MRKITGILPAIVLAVAVTAAQESYPAQSNDTTEEMLIKNERALHEAVAKADKASFRSLVLPDGVWTTREGFVPMALLVDGLEVFQLTKWDIINPVQAGRFFLWIPVLLPSLTASRNRKVVSLSCHGEGYGERRNRKIAVAG